MDPFQRICEDRIVTVRLQDRIFSHSMIQIFLRGYNHQLQQYGMYLSGTADEKVLSRCYLWQFCFFSVPFMGRHRTITRTDVDGGAGGFDMTKLYSPSM